MTIKDKKGKVEKVYSKFEKEWIRTGMQSVNEFKEHIQYETNIEKLDSLQIEMEDEIIRMEGMKDA